MAFGRTARWNFLAISFAVTSTILVLSTTVSIGFYGFGRGSIVTPGATSRCILIGSAFVVIIVEAISQRSQRSPWSKFVLVIRESYIPSAIPGISCDLPCAWSFIIVICVIIQFPARPLSLRTPSRLFFVTGGLMPGARTMILVPLRRMFFRFPLVVS